MNPIRSIARTLVIAWFALLLVDPGEAGAGQYWLSIPLDRAAADKEFIELSEALRNSTALLDNTNVFKLYGGIVSLVSDDVLRGFFELLREHRVALGMEMPVLSKNNWNNCGSTTEGFTTRSQIDGWMRKIKKNGGELSRLAMDEPLFYGHVYDGDAQHRTACHVPIAELAKDAADNLRGVREIFPGVHIGDIEPVSFSDAGPSPSRADLSEWFAAFREAWGTPIEFFHYDFLSSARAVDGLGEYVKFVGGQVPNQGFILDAAPGIESDSEWFQSAMGRADMMMPFVRSIDADIIIQDWKPFPRKLYPASAPDSFLGFYAARLQRIKESHRVLPFLFLVSARDPLDRALLPLEATTGKIGYRETSVFLYATAGDRPNLVEIVAGRSMPGGAAQLLLVNGRAGPGADIAAPKRVHLGFALPPEAPEGVALYAAFNREKRLFLYTLVQNEYDALPERTWRKDGVVFKFPRL